MSYIPNLFDRAFALAVKSHEGQKDLAGVPYIAHICEVISGVSNRDERWMIVAALHDILEDTDVTREYLLGEFPQWVVNNVVVLTRIKDQSYANYIAGVRSCGSEIAVDVKISDLRHNMDIRRLKNMSENCLKRVDKYRAAERYLLTGRSGYLRRMEEIENQ